jgi:hypothetical protein
MKIEVLYPEICTLYGDKGNTMYLAKCLPNAEFISTGLNEKPLFLRENIDMVYICSMSEKSQEIVLDRLMKYRDDIAQSMKDGKALFFMVGNALELLGDYIKREDGSRVKGLGIIPGMYSERQAPNRFNNLMKMKVKDMTLIGYSSRFAHTYGIPEDIAFGRCEMGKGSNQNTELEGISTGRILATYLLGPVLVQNPQFTHYLLQKLDADVKELPYEKALKKAYDVKLAEYDRPELELF